MEDSSEVMVGMQNVIELDASLGVGLPLGALRGLEDVEVRVTGTPPGPMAVLDMLNENLAGPVSLNNVSIVVECPETEHRMVLVAMRRPGQVLAISHLETLVVGDQPGLVHVSCVNGQLYMHGGRLSGGKVGVESGGNGEVRLVAVANEAEVPHAFAADGQIFVDGEKVAGTA